MNTHVEILSLPTEQERFRFAVAFNLYLYSTCEKDEAYVLYRVIKSVSYKSFTQKQKKSDEDRRSFLVSEHRTKMPTH